LANKAGLRPYLAYVRTIRTQVPTPSADPAEPTTPRRDDPRFHRAKAVS
jgi:hypothetical protein